MVCNLLYSSFSKKLGNGMDEEDAFDSDDSEDDEA
jgi:hypothetical protein